MSYRPPHSRMREIKQRAVPERGRLASAAVVQPANVEEALKTVSEPAPEAPPEPKPEPDPIVDEAPGDDATPQPEDDTDTTEVSLDMKRDELNTVAVSLGVENPDKLPNKQAVIDAINEVKGGRLTGGA